MANSRRQQNRSWLVLVILGGVLILLAAILIFWAANQNNAGEPTPSEVGSDPAATVERISLADAKTVWDNGGAVFLDVRSQAEYEQAHIPGAVLIPLNELDSRLNELDPAARIISYCT